MRRRIGVAGAGAPLLRQKTAQFELGLHLVGQEPQHGRLIRGEAGGATVVVEHAEGAEGGAVGAVQGRSCVKPDARIACDQWVGRETRIVLRIVDQKQRVLAHGVVAEGQIPGCLVDSEPDLGLEPLALFVNQADGGHRRPANARRGLHEIVEDDFRRRIQDVEPLQGAQSRIFRPSVQAAPSSLKHRPP